MGYGEGGGIGGWCQCIYAWLYCMWWMGKMSELYDVQLQPIHENRIVPDYEKNTS